MKTKSLIRFVLVAAVLLASFATVGSARAGGYCGSTYTVPQSNMTVNAVACYFGDVDPAAIMQVNKLTSPILTLGTVLTIP